MKIHTIATALVAVTAAFGIATATPASAADPARSGSVGLPDNGSRAHFPTWFWGATQLCVHNDGFLGDGEARVQTWLGADPEYLPVAPGETKCVRRWWGGVPIAVTNTKYSPLTAWTR